MIEAMSSMSIGDARPDLVVSLDLDPFAPRAARHHVAQVGHPSPDLRDAVVLLTGELVTRAAQQCRAAAPEAAELRMWMADDVVRVELRTRHAVLSLLHEDDSRRYGEMILRQVADRWSIDSVEDSARMWFEIDRHGRESRHQAA